MIAAEATSNYIRCVISFAFSASQFCQTLHVRLFCPTEGLHAVFDHRHERAPTHSVKVLLYLILACEIPNSDLAKFCLGVVSAGKIDLVCTLASPRVDWTWHKQHNDTSSNHTTARRTIAAFPSSQSSRYCDPLR